jgi:mono/diheme cytochrome c family protein
LAKRGTRLRGAVVLVVLVSVCVGACFPLPDMGSSVVVHSQEQPMDPPAGTLAIDAPRIVDRREARFGLINPRPASADVLKEGAELYRTYCVMCHGESGVGDGAVAQHFRRVPDLKTPYIQNYTDGRLYTVLREGGSNMPPYAEALSVDERWAVVHFVRSFESTP